jgi:uncharacterized membrane protein HdeD (DUF308 family)
MPRIWAFGLLVGADMVISGITLIGLGADIEERREVKFFNS